jgi:hypothetical protein
MSIPGMQILQGPDSFMPPPQGAPMMEQGMPPMEQPIPPMPPPPPKKKLGNLKISDQEQQDVLRECRVFLQYVQTVTRQKKAVQERAFRYSKNQLGDGDLLSLAMVEGQNDNLETGYNSSGSWEMDESTNGAGNLNEGRPRVFNPITRQVTKAIYAQLKMSLFGNDDGWFRIRGKNEKAAELEDELTKGMVQKCAEHQITEKLSVFILNLIIASNAAVHPMVINETAYEWQVDEVTGTYKEVKKEGGVNCTIESFSPLSFYIDPKARNSEKARWVHRGWKALHEIQENSAFFNTDDLATNADAYGVGDDEYTHAMDMINGYVTQQDSGEKRISYDLYYFPVLELEGGKTYRNMMVGIANENTVIMFKPNVYPKGMNPVVFCNYMPDTDTIEGTGPIEDLIPIQRMVNLLENYKMETIARNGNTMMVSEDVDLNSMHPAIGGIGIVRNGGRVQDSVLPIIGDVGVLGALSNEIGQMKADALSMTGGVSPFQGSSDVDHKKTATELQLFARNGMGIERETIEHIATMGIIPTLERYMYLMAEYYRDPFPIRLNSGDFVEIDFSPLKSGEYYIELTNVNPAESKVAQVNVLKELFSAIKQDPALIPYAKHNGMGILLEVLRLNGINNTDDLLLTPNELKEMEDIIMQEQQQGGGMPPMQQGGQMPPMEGM